MFQKWVGLFLLGGILGCNLQGGGSSIAFSYHPGMNTVYTDYKTLILSDKPIGYWRLGDTAGTTAVDLASNPHNGTYVSNYTLNQPGALFQDTDPAVSVTNGIGAISVPENSSLDMAAGNFSMECWFKTNQAAAGGNFPYIVGKDDNNGAARQCYDLYIVGGSNVLSFALCSSGTFYGATSATAVNDGNWHHAVGTRSGLTLSLYIDGSLNTSNTTAGNNSNVTNAIALGFGGSTDGWAGSTYTGVIDEVAIYSYALSATQVSNHYNMGAHKTPVLAP